MRGTGNETIVVVDDDQSVRKALRRFLSSAGFRVEAFASGDELLDRMPSLDASSGGEPICLVLDVQMPERSGLVLQEELLEQGLEPAIVFLTGFGTLPMGINAMKRGAVDFLEKPFEDEELLSAIRRGLERDRRRRESRAQTHSIQSRFARLTAREREVFELVATGLPNKQVAGRLGNSEKTVKVHRGRIMQKMEAQSLADLVRMAEELRRSSVQGYDQGPIAGNRTPL